MVADKGKKRKAVESGGEDENEHIDGELVLAIKKLQEIQVELEKVNEEASDKVLELEQKYNEIRRPIYVKRNGIVQSIPDFWLTAFLSHPVLCDILNEKDHKIFKHLLSLDVEDYKDVKAGYSIIFNFSPNPYFEDEKLTKKYSFTEGGSTNVSGTTIKWKEGMDIANGDARVKKGKKRALTDASFFSWFSEAQHKNLSEGVVDEVAEIIKEDLWPNPLKYFNEADDFDGDGDEDDEEASDNEDSEQDDDDEDEEEDE